MPSRVFVVLHSLSVHNVSEAPPHWGVSQDFFLLFLSTMDRSHFVYPFTSQQELGCFHVESILTTAAFAQSHAPACKQLCLRFFSVLGSGSVIRGAMLKNMGFVSYDYLKIQQYG